MMNKDITTLIYKGLYSHQTFIKNILLMKRGNRSGRPYAIWQMMIFSVSVSALPYFSLA